jgi:Tetracyclin repressor-like, C-terminal domain
MARFAGGSYLCTQRPAEAPARDRLAATLAGFCAWAREHDPFARVLVRECLMGTPGLYPRVMGAEAPLVGEFEAILREGIARGELRDDVPAELLALAIAGLTDLALVEHWASDGTSRSLEAIPELVLTLLLGPDLQRDQVLPPGPRNSPRLAGRPRGESVERLYCGLDVRDQPTTDERVAQRSPWGAQIRSRCESRFLHAALLGTLWGSGALPDRRRYLVRRCWRVPLPVRGPSIKRHA